MIKIIKQLEKFKDNIASRFLVEVANSKRISNFSKEVIGTKQTFTFLSFRLSIF